MDIEVYFGGQRRESIPYRALPALRLFCKQHGFQIKWDPAEKRIDLEPGLRGKVIVLAAGAAGGDAGLEWDVLVSVQTFLQAAGAEVVIWEKGAQLPATRDVAIRFTVKENRKLDTARLVLLQPDDELRKGLKNSLLRELKHTGLPCQTRLPRKGKNLRLLPVHWQLPPGMELSMRAALAEKISFYLASGILGYFQATQQIDPFSFLLPQLPSAFLGSIFSTALVVEREREQEERAAVEPEAKEHGAAGEQPEAAEEQGTAVAAGDVPLTEEQQESSTAHHAAAAEPSALVAVEESKLEVVPVTASVATMDRGAEEQALPRVAAQLEVEKRLEAEVYLDYTLMHSESENRPYLLIGTLLVKNTGTEHLYNPLVCLRVSPLSAIEMGGQVLPPNMVETLGVQSAAGIKGWKYVDDEWFEQARSRGEYWITPIRPMQIPPNMSESFQNFQISFLKQEARTTVTVEGMALFNDQQLQCIANNRIAISF